MAAKNIEEMNDFCIIEIFKFLSNRDLTQLSLTTKRFRQLVLNHVVPQMQVDLHLYPTLGKFATTISYNGYSLSDVEDFLETLLHYCTPGLLTNISLWYSSKDGNRQIDQNLIDRTAKQLENVKILRCFHVDQTNEWLNSISSYQIRTLDLNLEGSHDFRLHPETFPNLIDCTILIDYFNAGSYSKHLERYNAVSEFIKRKSQLRKFSYRDHRFHEQMIFKSVAENCLNITSLGILKIRCNGAGPDLAFLRQCQHLETITLQIGIFSVQKFTDVFNVLMVLRKLKTLYIAFVEELQNTEEIVTNELVSFIKSNRRRSALLDYMELYMAGDVDEDIAQHLCCMIASVFRVKTLSLVIHQSIMNSKLLSLIVRNLQGLEHLSIDEDCILDSLTWSNLMLDKIALNNTLDVSKKLIIYFNKKCEATLTAEVGSVYDPQIIAIASNSNFVFRDCKM